MGTGVESAGGPDSAPFPTGADGLEISVLGEVAVRRGGAAVELPRSRKCRALIAYLAATARPHRREALCELLWEVPDDPRSELRWTLSKLRGVLGDALVTDRETVALDPRAARTDAAALLEAARDPGAAEIGLLERLAARRGEIFGPDLDLPRCPEFQAWLYAIREDVRQAQLAVLGELVRRFAADPGRALPYARTQVACDPLDEGARLRLIDLLTAAGRAEEAVQQRGLAVEVLREAGIAIPSELARPRKPASAPPGRASSQRIQFCTARDGTRIAWSAVGSGPPLVKSANWMSHLEYEWESPFLRHWMIELARGRTLVRYDTRGNGLSDRRAADLTLDGFVQDLEAVTGQIDAERFDLIGISQGSAMAVAYAARHPERVRKLVLFGGFATGWSHSKSAEVHARWNAMLTLTEVGWGRDNPAFRQLFTSQFLPKATAEQADWFNELQRVSASPREAQRLQKAMGEIDVADLLPQVRAPTLVLHCRGDAMVSFGAGRYLAAHIPGAEFVPLESDNHLPLEGEPAWQIFVDRLREFLDR